MAALAEGSDTVTVAVTLEPTQTDSSTRTGSECLVVKVWDEIRVVAELLQWTESQVRARGLWTMPAPPERARTPAHNPVPVKRDIPKQLTVLVELVLDSLEKMEMESETWHLEQTKSIIDTQIRDKVLNQLRGGEYGGPCAYLCTLGRYNVGKTLLLNALLYADVLPTSQDAETAVVVYVQHCEVEVPVLYNFSDGKMLREGVDNIREYLKEVQRDIRLSRALSKQEYLLKIQIACFIRPSGKPLNKHQVKITPLLVDTPGSNEVSQKDLQSIAHLNLQTAAAYIYVMSFFDLRNSHDYAAFEKILWKDKNIFRDSRVAIVVTRMDESYQEVKESERISDEDVKQIVSNGIKKALGLDFVSPDIVFPVSGKLAFQAREAGKNEGVKSLDELKIIWGNIHRSSRGLQAFYDASSMTSEKLCADLEQASQLAALESRIGMMIDKLDYIWRRSAATNCSLAIDQALGSLNGIHDALDKEVYGHRQIIADCESIRQLHQCIVSSLQEESELLRSLDSKYMSDTISEKMLEKREIRELLDAFIADIRGKAEVGNYLPGDLKNDLSDFCKVAHDTVTNACWQTKFEHCHNLIMSYVMTTSESYGRLRKTLSDLCQHTGAYGSLSVEGTEVGGINDAFGTSEPPRLDQITTEHIQVPLLKYILFGFSMIFGGKVHIHFISNDNIQVIQENIEEQLKAIHCSFFTGIKKMIILYFFKQYCQQIVALMRKRPCSLDGLIDVESNALDKLREKEEQRDMCECWINELKRWKGRLVV